MEFLRASTEDSAKRIAPIQNFQFTNQRFMLSDRKRAGMGHANSFEN